MLVQIAKTEADILKCWEVLSVLRPHLKKETFVATVQEMMHEGYVLVFIEEGGKAVSAAGYRYLQYLYIGKHYYIDDLSTLEEARGKGYGGMLLDYVSREAKKNNLAAVTLDSGYTRNTAHRLYLNKGFKLAAHHFEKRF
ncbi:MAG TPA: GNAT family N-acetyltransferase [Chitinophagaceae bacterium]|nr:GNAT family N-acetyltransferase [Chitinophagaceae bacterium]